MPTKLPRLNVTLEQKLYKFIEKLSKKEGLSMSIVARDLLKDALLLYEDSYWDSEAATRARTLSKNKLVSHQTVWNRLS